MREFWEDVGGILLMFGIMAIMAATCAVIVLAMYYVHPVFIVLMIFAPPFWIQCLKRMLP